MPFTGFIIAAAGNLKKPYTHGDLEAVVNTHGGEFSENCDVDCDVTHLVCSQAAYQAKTQKVRYGIAKGSVKIVDVSWIEACLKHGKALPEARYLFEKKKSSAVVKASVGKNTTKPLFDRSDSDSAGETTSDRAQVQPARIYAFRSGDNKGTGISGALGAKQIIKLDPGWISERIPHVYRSPEKESYEISLVRCNISERGATNELMNLQILKTDIGPHAPQYVLCGRTLPHKSEVIYGEPNPGPESTPDVLINVYESELEKRTAQGYLLVDLDRSIDIDLEAAPSEQTLKARNILYSLLKLILPNPELTNPKGLKAKSAEYDKLIFKNLSKTSIKNGEEILAKLEKIIADSSDKQKATEESKSAVFELTSQYYSCIPHSDLGLGTNGPVVLLDSRKKIRKELDMLGSLEEITLSTALAREISLTDNGHDETLNEHFKTLSLKNIDVVGRDLQEFKLIERYFVNTGGRSGIPASWTLQIFRIERFGDEERWNSAGWDKMAEDSDGRYLLWYGTPLDNMGTILKEGLKDEFERGGIFFSDTAETSLDCSQQFGGFKNKIVTMLLCEVQLGHIPYNSAGGKSIGNIGSQLGKMDYEWTDAGPISQNLQGVRMPDVENTNSCLYERVEYVARHSPSQIKHRYIVYVGPR